MVGGATKRHGEALITNSIEPGMVLCRCDMGEPRCPKKHRPQHLIENSLPRLSPPMFGRTKSRPTNSGRLSRPFIRHSLDSENRHPEPGVSEHLPSRSGDPSTA